LETLLFGAVAGEEAPSTLGNEEDVWRNEIAAQAEAASSSSTAGFFVEDRLGSTNTNSNSLVGKKCRTLTFCFCMVLCSPCGR
jgi:hypothetical protein